MTAWTLRGQGTRPQARPAQVLPPALARRFEAAVFEWERVAVRDVRANAAHLRAGDGARRHEDAAPAEQAAPHR